MTKLILSATCGVVFCLCCAFYGRKVWNVTTTPQLKPAINSQNSLDTNPGRAHATISPISQKIAILARIHSSVADVDDVRQLSARNASSIIRSIRELLNITTYLQTHSAHPTSKGCNHSSGIRSTPIRMGGTSTDSRKIKEITETLYFYRNDSLDDGRIVDATPRAGMRDFGYGHRFPMLQSKGCNKLRIETIKPGGLCASLLKVVHGMYESFRREDKYDYTTEMSKWSYQCKSRIGWQCYFEDTIPCTTIAGSVARGGNIEYERCVRCT